MPGADGSFPLEQVAAARRVIRDDGRVDVDAWTWLADDEALPDPDVDIVVSLARLGREHEVLRGRAGRLGVTLETDALADEIAPHLEHLALVAIHVHKFVDGRFYSTGRLLRMRHGYTGELRAYGDVLPDQLFFMRRCGFDSFELRAGKRLETALRALEGFTVVYQGAEDVAPLYRRRA